MKPTSGKPLVTICTYQERQDELRNTAMMQDEVDHRSSNCNVSKTEYNNLISSSLTNGSNGYYPTPPPPPQFANKSENYIQQMSPPNSPAADYQSPVHTLTRSSNGPFRNGTLTRRDHNCNKEVEKANCDAAELESIDSYQMKNPSSMIPRPPSLYFAPQSSGPPTMKKNKRPVSVTIGEYSSKPVNRKEPSKLEFIAKPLENAQQEVPVASDLLRSELEQTLIRSNLKKRNEDKNCNDDLNLENTTSELQNVVLRQRNSSGNHAAPCYGKPILQKTQSSNIEKLTQMLQSRQSVVFDEDNSNGTLPNPSRVTINLPHNHSELRKTESTPQQQSATFLINGNGILKNGSTYSRNSYTSSEKSITFDN